MQRARRHIVAYLLLAAYLPMLLVQTFHTHTPTRVAEQACYSCLKHVEHPSHFGKAQKQVHDCLYCQLAQEPRLVAQHIGLDAQQVVVATITAAPVCCLPTAAVGNKPVRGSPVE